MHAFDEHVATAMEFDESRPQEVAFTKTALRNGRVLLDHFDQVLPCALLVRRTGLRLSPAFPLPPIIRAGLAVQRAFAGNRHILLLKGINQRGIIVAFHAFKAGRNGGKVRSRVCHELKHSTFLQVEFHVALQMNGTGKELAVWNHHAATAGLSAGGNGLPESFGAVAGAARASAICGGQKIAVRKQRWLDARQDPVGFIPCGGGVG